jgi:hypothetical protein
MSYRYVFIDNGNYVERIETPKPGTSYAVQEELKRKWGAKTLVLLDPNGKDYQDWLTRVPLEDRVR